MSEKTALIDRREPRYQVTRARAVRVIIERASGITQETLEAELSDLSPSGAKLRVESPTKVQFQEAILLRLESPDIGLNLTIHAKVCWIRGSAGDTWTLGCTFSPSLPEHCIQELFNRGLLERRRNNRRSVRGQAVARWELDAAATNVGLLDISSGGFSVLAPKPAKPGSRMSLRPEKWRGNDAEVTARVQWLLRVDGGFVIGCEFCDSRDFVRLRDTVCGGLETELDTVEREPRISMIALLGIVAIVGWMCSFFIGR
jgi:c-di-GMP-binding flagellar brake protein YcgR